MLLDEYKRRRKEDSTEAEGEKADSQPRSAASVFLTCLCLSTVAGLLRRKRIHFRSNPKEERVIEPKEERVIEWHTMFTWHPSLLLTGPKEGGGGGGSNEDTEQNDLVGRRIIAVVTMGGRSWLPSVEGP